MIDQATKGVKKMKKLTRESLLCHISWTLVLAMSQLALSGPFLSAFKPLIKVLVS